MRVAAARPGVSRGQCAEYCGGPHALMALYVVAAAPDEFDRWRERQRQPAAAAHPLFEASCAVCHAIRGTGARGTLGPDLTHVGGRLSIAAATLPNNAATLATWIASSQHVKPGNLMPSFATLRADELRDVAAYLASLE
jgi:cytochrome c oxidase subunit 2